MIAFIGILVMILVFIAVGCSDAGRQETRPEIGRWEDMGQWPYLDHPFFGDDTTVHILGLATTANGNIWAAGEAGYTAYWDGTKWQGNDQWPHDGVQITQLVTTPDDSIWAVGGEGGYTAYWNGTNWINTGQWPHNDKNIHALIVAMDGSIWAAGESGYTARFLITD